MKLSLKWGRLSSILLSLITIVTFVVAMFAVPISGNFAPGEGLSYPYLNTLDQIPRDYLWMPLAIIMMVMYLIVFTEIHYSIEGSNKPISQLALNFANLSTGILVVNYFIQFSIVPVSLLNGQTDGITLLTQYNPYGLFIILEELGYLVMSLSFLFVALAFAHKTNLEKLIKRVFLIAAILGLLSFVLISAVMGENKLDVFEVVIILINWFVLIFNGILLSKWFKNRLRGEI